MHVYIILCIYGLCEEKVYGKIGTGNKGIILLTHTQKHTHTDSPGF